MRRRSTSRSHRDRTKSPRNEDRDQAPRSRTEEEKQRRRREWLIQQEMEREHERLKRKKIMEYEMKRARELEVVRQRRSRSKSRSRSVDERHRRPPPKTLVLSEKTDATCGSIPLFKGPEGLKISSAELRRIKVDIHRKIPAPMKLAELQREIINPEDVIVKRREGEGAKPIFEREELKRPVSGEEIEEHRRVVTVVSEKIGKTQYPKRRSASLSPTTDRTHRSQPTSSRYLRREGSRHHDSRTDYYSRHKSDNDRDRSRDRSAERRERFKEEDDKRRASSRAMNKESARGYDDRRDRGRSKERESRNRDRDSSCHSRRSRSSKGERSYRDYRDRSKDRSHETWRRERSRGGSVPSSHYIEQVPVSIYYGPRPIMVGPMMPYRGQVPMVRGRPAPVMGPIRPFPQRFIPPDIMYRLGPPPNPRFGPFNSY